MVPYMMISIAFLVGSEIHTTLSWYDAADIVVGALLTVKPYVGYDLLTFSRSAAHYYVGMVWREFADGLVYVEHGRCLDNHPLGFAGCKRQEGCHIRLAIGESIQPFAICTTPRRIYEYDIIHVITISQISLAVTAYCFCIS